MRVVRKEGAALAEGGYRVRHLCRAEAAPPNIGAVEVEAIPARSRLAALPRLARRAAALRPAVVHASEPDAWAAALWAGRRCGARVVLDVHEHYPSRLDGRLPRGLRGAARSVLRRGLAAMARQADAVVLAKDGLAADYPGARAVAVRNHAVIPAGLAPRRYRPGALTLVHLGALARSRGWPVMLEALSLMPEATRLLLLGRFTDGSEAAFRAEAARLRLAARIEVAGWLPAEEALRRAAAEADINLVLLQPGPENHRLALPHKVFDAMACGLPSIVPSFAEQLAPLVAAGVAVSAATEDAASVAAAAAALADPALRARMGAAARAAAEGEWGWPRQAEALRALYAELLAA